MKIIFYIFLIASSAYAQAELFCGRVVQVAGYEVTFIPDGRDSERDSEIKFRFSGINTNYNTEVSIAVTAIANPSSLLYCADLSNLELYAALGNLDFYSSTWHRSVLTVR